MSKYIEVEKADPYLYDHLDDSHMAAAKNALNDMPAADVVDKERYVRLLANAIIVSNALKEYKAADFFKVVRCKDCKWHAEEARGMVYCPHIVVGWVSNGFFCADGERRGDADDNS